MKRLAALPRSLFTSRLHRTPNWRLAHLMAMWCAARTAPCSRTPAPLRGDLQHRACPLAGDWAEHRAHRHLGLRLMALFSPTKPLVKWESLWVIFVEVAPPPPPRPAPTSLTPSLSAVMPLCRLATAHVLRRDGGGARQRVRDV